MTLVLGIVYGLAMLIFLIAFLISWFKSREQVRSYKNFGVLAGIILIIFEILVMLLVGSKALSSISPLRIIVTDTIAFFRMMAYTIVGIHMCTFLGYRSFPLLKPRMGISKTTETNDSISKFLDTSDPLEAEEHEIIGKTASTVQTERYSEGLPSTGIEQQPFTQKINIKTYTSITLAVVACSVLYSSILFFITSPEMSDIVRQKFGESVSGTDNTLSLVWLLLLLEFAFAEEIVFRLGIQNYLARQFNWQGNKYWIAIILTATLWTIAHTGVLKPDWVKLMQIFPIGLALGWLFRKLGTESCILAHGLFNVVMAVLSPIVLTLE